MIDASCWQLSLPSPSCPPPRPSSPAPSGMVDAYWQFNLKPWDVAAGVLIAEEAGARISTADGTAFSVFDK